MQNSRTTTRGFTARTRKNLQLVRNAFDSGQDFHVVTQLVNSLLGIVVVPTGRHAKDSFLSVTLQKLHEDGWPKWDFTGKEGSESETLGDFLRGLRNAAAHGHYDFLGEPDSRNVREVRIMVSDGPTAASPWRYEIQGDQLYEFCIRLANFIEEHVG